MGTRFRRLAVTAAVALPIVVFSGQGPALGAGGTKGEPVMPRGQDLPRVLSAVDVVGPPGVSQTAAAPGVKASASPSPARHEQPAGHGPAAAPRDSVPDENSGLCGALTTSQSC